VHSNLRKNNRNEQKVFGLSVSLLKMKIVGSADDRQSIKQILKGDAARGVAHESDRRRRPKGQGRSQGHLSSYGKAHVIGTGAAGTGKSSLIDRMTAEYRRRKIVGILAVDPTSLFRPGRFGRPDSDARPFCRRRCFYPKLRDPRKQWRCRRRFESIHLLDAAGKEVIFVETIGVGQDQLEIAAWLTWLWSC
jgi:hypothetical protein